MTTKTQPVLSFAKLEMGMPMPHLLDIQTRAFQALLQPDGKGATRTLSRRSGDQLRLVSAGGGRFRQPGLTIQGAGMVIPLPFFSTKEVRRQCVAAGWSFAGRRPQQT